MRIALVHDQLHEFGGAERVLVALKGIYPDADIFTAFYTKDRLKKRVPDFESWNIKESFAARIPFIRRLYSPLRFLAPFIWESFDFSGYDAVISSSGWYMCKCIPSRPRGQAKPIHICYLHHPPRYLYGYETAVEWQRYWPVKIYANIVNHFLRMWDFESSQRPDFFIANSQETKRRIKKFYRRDAMVIYPPVSIPKNLESRISNLAKKKYYITVSRLTRAKHVDVLIEAANKLKFNLKIVGTGRDEKSLKSIAGPTVEFLGSVDDGQLADLYRGARAFLFASVDEEFGIAPVEAMGYGVPVIAYKSGGLVETVKDGLNGFLFDDLSVNSFVYSFKRLNDLGSKDYKQMRKAAREEAEKYDMDRFKKEFLQFIRKANISIVASRTE